MEGIGESGAMVGVEGAWAFSGLYGRGRRLGVISAWCRDAWRSHEWLIQRSSRLVGQLMINDRLGSLAARVTVILVWIEHLALPVAPPARQ